MKIVYLGTSFAILYFMRFHKVVKCTYDREQDAFRYQFLVLPCLVLAFLLPNAWTPFEVCCRASAHHWPGSSSSAALLCAANGSQPGQADLSSRGWPLHDVTNHGRCC